MSAPPPGANGTIMRTGLDGYRSCAKACATMQPLKIAQAALATRDPNDHDTCVPDRIAPSTSTPFRPGADYRTERRSQLAAPRSG